MLILVLDNSNSQAMVSNVPLVGQLVKDFSFKTLQDHYWLQGLFIAGFFLLVSLINFFANTYIAKKNPEMYRLALAKTIKAMKMVRGNPDFARNQPKEISFQVLKRLLASELRYLVAAWALLIRSIPVVATLVLGFVSLLALNSNLSLVVLASVLVGIPLLALPVLRGGAIGARIRNEARKQANFLAQEGERLVYDLPGSRKESDDETILRLNKESGPFLSALVKRQTVSDVTALVVDAYVVCLLTAIIIFILNETASGALNVGQAIAIVIIVRLFLASVRSLMRSATNFYATHPIIQNLIPILLSYHKLGNTKTPQQNGPYLPNGLHLMVTPEDVFFTPVSTISQIGYRQGIQRDVVLISHNKKNWVSEEFDDNKFALLADEPKALAKELVMLGHLLSDSEEKTLNARPSEEAQLMVNMLFLSVLEGNPIVYLDGRAIPNNDANTWKALALLSTGASIIVTVDSDTRLALLIENITRFELRLNVLFANLLPIGSDFEIVNYGQTPLTETQWAEIKGRFSKKPQTKQNGFLDEEEFELIG